MTAKWIIDEMESWAPTTWAEKWDNVGLLIGDISQKINKVLVALDATDDVINEAIEGNYNCIITHHPLLFTPVKRITSEDTTGRKILKLIKHNICLYAAHTNLDAAPDGVNDVLAEKLDIKNIRPMIPDALNPAIGAGRIGTLENEITLAELIEHVKTALNLKEARYTSDLNKKIKKVAICGGSGMGYWHGAVDCDVYITGDVKYSDALKALETGLSIVDITHYSGEAIIIEAIVNRLRKKAKHNKISLEINPTSVNGQTLFTL